MAEMADMAEARVLKIGASTPTPSARASELDWTASRNATGSRPYRLAEAFTRVDGDLDESEHFHAWGKAWASFQILTGR